MNRPLNVILVVAALVACGLLAWSGFNRGGPKRAIPEGVQTLTGSLVPAELSLKRRGTHVLKIDGEDAAFVESTTVNLRTYELTEVGVTGTFHLNTDPSDLPVLIVSSIRPVEIDARSVDLPSIGLTLNVPTDWSLQTFDDGVAFSLTGSTTPLLRVMKTSLTRLPAEGAPILVGGYDAVRVDVADGQSVFLQSGRVILSFTWSSRDDAHTAAFAQLLRTAVVRGTSSSSVRAMTGGIFVLPSSSPSVASAGSVVPNGVGRPCGGPAGVLCGAGTYCSVNSPDGVGTCVAL